MYNIINGGPGDDILTGTAGDDEINGFGGADVINGGPGYDVIWGGDGDDTINAGDDGSSLSGGAGDDVVNGGAAADVVDGGIGNDVLNGGGGDDSIVNWFGDDILNGGDGDDYFNEDAGDGNDIIDGGEGHDTLGLSWNRDQHLVVQHQDGTLELRSLLGGDTNWVRNVETFSYADYAVNVEQLLADGPSARATNVINDAVTVAEDAETANLWNTLLANDSDADANDAFTIVGVSTTGTAGTVVFDAATQTLRYVADAAVFDALEPGQTATDTFTYTVRDSFGIESTATATMTVTGASEDDGWIYGTPQSDVMTGTAGADKIRSLDDDDQVFAGGGDDIVEAGDGDDYVNGGAGADQLSGGTGADVLLGGAGSDLLAGGAGADLLTGGAGNDVFVFRPGETHGDRITDFGGHANKDEDLMRFEGFGEGAYLTRQGNSYTVHYDGGEETFTMHGATQLDAGDYLFI